MSEAKSRWGRGKPRVGSKESVRECVGEKDITGRSVWTPASIRMCEGTFVCVPPVGDDASYTDRQTLVYIAR